MPLLALLASDSEIVPVGAIELWWVKRAPTCLGELLDQLRRHLGDALHVAAVARVQHAAGDAAPTFQPSAPSPGACAASRR
jgi:hypothetical protein